MNREDFETGAWKRLSQALEARLAELRSMNDSVGLNNESTCVIRGKIAEVKRILALPGSASEGGAADD